MPTLRDVVDLVHGWYPPDTADEHDAVGLVHGDPGQGIDRVMFAVDPTVEVAREAAEWGADLLVEHHPLCPRPTHARPGTALLTAHTNADRAAPGVSDALAAALGLMDVRPIRPVGDPL